MSVVAGGVDKQTIVTFVNKVVEKGYLEVCKKAKTGTTLTGEFKFDVTAGGVSRTVTAPVGGCSPALHLPAGDAKITETVRSDAELVILLLLPPGGLSAQPTSPDGR